ncbi:MAG: hypothetical protein P8J88_08845 [Phycisphaerales bacterium]|nr:hypothetical protein [Phycisphaerales bacterium]MDG1977855.1 hypothetical protein [Phycisphaerales bacterium]MDG2133580.1 hypothetical protein [Phycisphaerales bacterium]
MSRSDDEPFRVECRDRFAALVESVGVKRFATSMDLSTRQVNRILNGVQPNPLERLLRSLQSAEIEAGDAAIDFLCGEMGGHFVRRLEEEVAVVNAVKECAEAIAALSDGEVDRSDRREIREAIAALESVLASHRSPDRD